VRYTRSEVCSISGLTIRQVEHAVRRGLIPVKNPSPGVGGRRVYTGASVAAAVKIAKAKKDLGVKPRPKPTLPQSVYDEIARILIDATEGVAT
jgi:hypothetical protein